MVPVNIEQYRLLVQWCCLTPQHRHLRLKLELVIIVLFISLVTLVNFFGGYVMTRVDYHIFTCGCVLESSLNNEQVTQTVEVWAAEHCVKDLKIHAGIYWLCWLHSMRY